MVLIIYAHPHPRHSKVNKTLLNSIKDLEPLRVHSIYDHYPDFNIDVLIEQANISEADTIVFQHPLQWYNMPSLLKLWFDRVFAYGWAYGDDGQALKGKNVLWTVTTGGGEKDFAIGDYPDFHALSQPLQKTALHCGMNWLPPFIIHNTYDLDDDALTQKTIEYRQHLVRHCHLTSC